MRKRQLAKANARSIVSDWNTFLAAGLLLMMSDVSTTYQHTNRLKLIQNGLQSLTLCSAWRESWEMLTNMVRKRAGREGILPAEIRCDPLARFLLDCLIAWDCLGGFCWC